MLKPRFTNQFKKDFKIAIKRGYDEKKFIAVLDKLLRQEPLPEKNKDHSLQGKWKNHRDCHIMPDWVLIYRVIQDELILELSRTGTHSDLFK